MRNYKISESLQKILGKLSKKDTTRFEATLKKIEEITLSADISHYKNLKHNLKKYKRVHIDSSFVLVFRYEERTNTVYFEDLQHHDDIYKR